MIKKVLQTLLIATACLLATDSAQAYKGKIITDVTQGVVKTVDLGGDSYMFTDAVNYRGSIYAVQLFKENSGTMGSVRICRMAQANDLYGTLSFSGYHINVTQGGIYQYAELVVWRDCLLLFWRNGVTGEIHLKRYKVDDNGDLQSQGNEKRTNNQVLYGKFATTVLNNELYLITGTRTNQRIRVEKTTADNPGENDWNFVNNVGKETNGKDAGGVDGIESSYYGPDDTWDAITWHGNIGGVSTSRIILVRMQNGWAEGYQFDGNQWITRAEKAIGRGDAFSMKLVQGAIKDATKDGTNPVQCVYATSNGKDVGEVFMLEYHPTDHAFTDYWITSIPYGWFGVTTGIVPMDEDEERDQVDIYRQIIYIISGNNPGYHGSWRHNYGTSLRSNVVSVHKSNRAITYQDYENENLRPLISLIGILEGPPPTVIDNQAWFDNQTKYGSSASANITSIEISSSVGNSKLLQQSFSTQTTMKIGPHTDDITAQTSVGNAFEKTKSQVITQELTTSYTFINDNYEKQGKAYLFYTAPQLIRLDAVYYRPSATIREIQTIETTRDEAKLRVAGMPTISSVLQQNPTLFIKELAISGKAPFHVGNPHDLTDWHKRTQFSKVKPAFILGFNFDTGTPVTNLKTNVTGTVSKKYTTEIGLVLKVPFFELENTQTLTTTEESSSTVGTNISVGIHTLDKSKVITKSDSITTSYNCSVILANHQNEVASQIYYPFLRDNGYMQPGEKPWLIAWDVIISKRQQTLSLLATANPTDNETITPEGNRVYNDGDALIVECTPGSHVQIYNISGRLEADQISPDGTLRTTLNRGIYIVRILSGDQVKVYKALKQ